MDIYDIPIAEITKQYMTYLDQMREMNLDIAGDYLVMAATLTFIKSRMLLPQESIIALDEEDGGDPRAELVRRLLEYQRYKEVADKLKTRPVLGRDVFASHVRVDQSFEDSTSLSEGLKEIDIVDLAVALNKILETAKDSGLEFQSDQVSILDAIHNIVDALQKGAEMVEVFLPEMTKPALISTFLAVLELVRLKLIRCYQHSQHGTIYVRTIGDIGDLHQLHLETFETAPQTEITQ